MNLININNLPEPQSNKLLLLIFKTNDSINHSVFECLYSNTWYNYLLRCGPKELYNNLEAAMFYGQKKEETLKVYYQLIDIP